ncbi:hypothetical protein SERLA73DRAFT_75383 [Serpula lacrymans var. lacrymans S7.3]|uniref:Uncharacterized protein n=1 Tax=Serpula lacrymans var. lacrymans (strain S7.3) TaxID=936435 RepID=F8Q3H9_SERL3|nr:hypothetical protein SERLA73DRAFT_75383 [Serpula lacrymans var. lacrymans S7.3]
MLWSRAGVGFFFLNYQTTLCVDCPAPDLPKNSSQIFSCLIIPIIVVSTPSA